MNLSSYRTHALTYDAYVNLSQQATSSETSPVVYDPKYHKYIENCNHIIEDVSRFLMLDKKLFNLSSKLKNRALWVITEPWCGDAAQILPVLYAIEMASAGMCDLSLFLRDQNEGLMNLFLTEGSQSIPIVILVDSDHNVINHWGPRSKPATEYVSKLKTDSLPLDEFIAKLSQWYAEDKTKSFQEEMCDFLKS